MAALPQVGTLEQILIRVAKGQPPESVDRVTVHADGLEGDHSRGIAARAKRQVTVIQAEHIPVIGALSGHPDLQATVLRRNLVVSGFPIHALEGLRVRIGAEVVLEWTAVCDPCDRMEVALGAGGRNAMTGMGGICCRVVVAGEIRAGDRVAAQAGSAE
jgi:MOSC domain-containing protein YiiM